MKGLLDWPGRLRSKAVGMSVETLIKKTQANYYKAVDLKIAHKSGEKNATAYLFTSA